MKRLALLDIDGVLADDRHRVHHALEREWGEYFSRMQHDGVWPRGRELHDACVYAGWEHGYLTGRREDYRGVTRAWLKDHTFTRRGLLLMRPADDRRKLCQLKADMIAELLREGDYERIVHYDDDPAVVAAINALHQSRIRAVHCTWYLKPEAMVRRQSS